MKEPAWKLSSFFPFPLGTSNSMTDWAEVKNKVKVKSVDFTTQIKRLGKHNLGK